MIILFIYFTFIMGVIYHYEDYLHKQNYNTHNIYNGVTFKTLHSSGNNRGRKHFARCVGY